MISPERLYLTADRETVVKHGDERARYLLVAEGGFIDIATARRYGLDDPANPAPPKPEPPKPPAPSPVPAPKPAPAFKSAAKPQTSE